MDKYFLFVLGSYTMVPILIVQSQNVMRYAHSWLMKASIIILCAILIAVFQYWEVKLQLLDEKAWSFYHSLLFWFAIVLIVTAVNAIFRRTLKQEVEIR